MPALVASINVFVHWPEVVDGRNKSGHDDAFSAQLRHCALNALRFSGSYMLG